MTVATSASMDRWVKNKVFRDDWARPAPEAVAKLVARLDQDMHTALTIDGPDAWYMIVGGGQGRYIAYIENQMTGSRYDLINPDGGADVQEIVACGQLGKFAGKLVVGLKQATEAVEEFARTGRPAIGLTWEHEYSA